MTDKEKREDLALLALAFAAFVGANCIAGLTMLVLMHVTLVLMGE